MTLMALSRTSEHRQRREFQAPLSSSSLRVGHRYATADGEVREIVSFDGGLVIYVVGRGGAFPVWDKMRWHLAIRPVFLSQIAREVR